MLFRSPGSRVGGVRISGDGSKVFCLIERSIQAWSIQTGEVVGKVEVEDGLYIDPLYLDGSRIWVCSKDSPAQGWDFGISGSSPSQLPNTPPDRPHLNPIGQWDTGPLTIKDEVTRRVVLQLTGGYATPRQVQWDGQYLVAGYDSGFQSCTSSVNICCIIPFCNCTLKSAPPTTTSTPCAYIPLARYEFYSPAG